MEYQWKVRRDSVGQLQFVEDGGFMAWSERRIGVIASLVGAIGMANGAHAGVSATAHLARMPGWTGTDRQVIGEAWPTTGAFVLAATPSLTCGDPAPRGVMGEQTQAFDVDEVDIRGPAVSRTSAWPRDLDHEAGDGSTSVDRGPAAAPVVAGQYDGNQRSEIARLARDGLQRVLDANRRGVLAVPSGQTPGVQTDGGPQDLE